jgi:hypothetical protein
MADEEEKDESTDKEGKETASLKKRLKKHEGDAMALAAELSAENADLNRQLSAAKGQKPKEGSLTLSPEQAAQWKALIALGKPEDVIAAYPAYVALGTPDEITAKKQERDAFETENADLKKTQLLQDIASDEKLKFSVLRDLDARDGGLQYEKREVIVDGKTTHPWHVKRGNNWALLSTQKEEGGPWADYKLILESAPPEPLGTKIPAMNADDKDKKREEPNAAKTYMDHTYKGPARAAAGQ